MKLGKRSMITLMNKQCTPITQLIINNEKLHIVIGKRGKRTRGGGGLHN